MRITTSRFGSFDMADDRIVTFPAGLLGFSAQKRWALLEPAADSAFFWLQSIDDPELALVVTDPSFFFPDFVPPMHKEITDAISLKSFKDVQVFVVVNKHANSLTANLQGPIIVNAASKLGVQIVIGEGGWQTRHEISCVAAPLMWRPGRGA